MPCARASSGLRKCTGFWSSRISPSSGTSAPESALISDDLPAPLSPITARISPGSNSKSTPSSAVTEPYRLTTPRASRTGFNASFMTFSSGTRPCEFVGGNRENHENAADQDLIDRRHADQREPVPEHAHDQRAQQGPDNRPASAEEARAAEHDGRDAVEVLRLPGLRIAHAGPRHRQQRRDAIEDARERVDRDQDALRRKPHQAGGFRVVAERVEMPAGNRIA